MAKKKLSDEVTAEDIAKVMAKLGSSGGTQRMVNMRKRLTASQITAKFRKIAKARWGKRKKATT
jgi:hypothetical protein